MPSSRSPARRPILLVVLAAAALLLTFLGSRVALERRGLRQELAGLREDVLRLRVASSECLAEIGMEEAAFREYHDRVDSLRDEILEFEALDDRGVPAEQYEEYLEVFERYNRSVPAWRARADSLQARWEACRDLVERHNTLADSLRGRVEALDDG